jgi:hypothetical protein
MKLKEREENGIVGVCPYCMESDRDDPNSYIKEGEKCYRVEFGHTFRSKEGGHIIFESMTETCYFEYPCDNYDEDPHSTEFDDTYANMFIHADCFEGIKWGKNEKQKEPINCGVCGGKLIGFHNIAVGESPSMMARITQGYADLDDKKDPDFTEIVQPDLIPDRYLCLGCITQLFECHTTIMESLEFVEQVCKQECDKHEKDDNDYIDPDDRIH